MIHRLLNSSILNSWFSNVVILVSSLIAIPIVITNLDVQEINIWFLFASVVAMSQSILFGFNGTFARFISYSFSGVKIKEYQVIKHKNNINFNETFCVLELSRIFYLMRNIYFFLSICFLFVLIIIGYFVLRHPVNLLTYPNEGWTSWMIIVASTTYTLSFGYYQVFLEGINKVALVQRTIGLVNLIGLPFILGILYFYPTLIAIVFIYQLISLITTTCIIYFAILERKKLGIKSSKNKIDKELFAIVWESAWKSGITTILANIVKHISAVLVAQLFSPAISASFLFTKRLFDVIERFTMTTFQARIPIIAKLRGQGDFKKLIPFLRQTQIMSFSVFLVGYSILLFFGESVLEIINSNVELVNFNLIILFSFATFLSRWGAMNMLISNQANHVVEHYNALIGSSVFFIVIYFLYGSLGINVFPVAQILSFIAVIFLFIKNVYPSIQETFYNYEKRLMLPMLGVLILINSIYYWGGI